MSTSTGAIDYAILQNERKVQNGMAPLYMAPYNLVDANGDRITGFGTDWQDLLFNDNAPITQHDVSISGASEQGNYYLSLGYFDQEGIVGFEVAGADGQFYAATARLNESHKSIMVSAEQVAAPTAVRYCFKAFQPGNLKSVRGLPVVPFRSDR